MITLRGFEELKRMERACAIVHEAIEAAAAAVEPGVTTEELDRRCHDYLRRVQKATPANVGYHGFPKTLCTSVNGVAVPT